MSTNFCHPIEHSVPTVAHLKERDAYIVGANYVQQVFELTIQRQYNVSDNVLKKIEKKMSFQNNNYCKKRNQKNGSKKSHKHK